MKTLLSLILFLLLLSLSVPAAVISLSGRIEGRLPGTVLDEVNYHTLDFYWFRVPEPTSVTIDWCVTNGPGGSWNTSLDVHIYPNADAHADLASIAAVAGIGDFCTSRIYSLPAGNYIFDVKPGDTGYDGDGGLVPFSESGRDFIHFDYGLTINGGIELYESWIGQTDRTFLITRIPEPGCLPLAAVACLLAMRRRKRSCGIRRHPGFLLVLGSWLTLQSLPAQQGVIEWDALPGMGYRLQRSGALGGGSSQWVGTSVDYYGAGERMWHQSNRSYLWPTQARRQPVAWRRCAFSNQLSLSSRFYSHNFPHLKL